MEAKYELDDVVLDWFEGVNLSEMLFYFIKELHLIHKKHLLKVFFNIYFMHFYERNTFEKKGNGKNVFLFSNEYFRRKDHEKNFDNVVGLSGNYLKMKGCGRSARKRKSSVPLKLIFTWNKQLRKKIPDLFDRMFIIEKLFEILTDYQDLEDYISRNKLTVQNFVTLCDVMSEDYYFTYKFNKKMANTFTLQHGVFSVIRSKEVFIYSHSKVFMVMNQYTIEEARRCGYHNGKMEVVGMLSAIGNTCKRKSFISERVNTVGVVLDSAVSHEDNCELLQIVEEYNMRANKQIKIKLHPAENEAGYYHFMKEKLNFKIVPKEKVIREFTKEVDVVVVRNSTCMVEVLDEGLPVLIWENPRKEGTYSKLNCTTKFSDAQELEELIKKCEKGENNKSFVEIRDYFIPYRDVKQKYMDTMKKYDLL